MIDALSHMTNASPLGKWALIVIAAIFAVVLILIAASNAFRRTWDAEPVNPYTGNLLADDVQVVRPRPMVGTAVANDKRVSVAVLREHLQRELEVEPAVPTQPAPPLEPAPVVWDHTGQPTWYREHCQTTAPALPASRHDGTQTKVWSGYMPARLLALTEDTGAWDITTLMDRELVGAGAS